MDPETTPLILALAALTGQPPTDPALRAACSALVAVLQHGYGRVCWNVHEHRVTLKPEGEYRIPPPTARRGPT